MINYGRNIRVVFNDILYGVNPSSYKAFSLTNEFSETISATSLFLFDAKTLEITFDDFNNFRGNVYLRYDGTGGLYGIDIPVDAFDIYPLFSDLRSYGDYEYFNLASVTASGSVDPLTYRDVVTSESIYMSVGTVTASGESVTVVYSTIETGGVYPSNDPYMMVGTVTASGNAYQIGEIPV